MSQSHFSDEYKHFVLHSVKDRHLPKKATKPSEKSRFRTPRHNTHKGVLTKEAEKIKKISQSRTKIFRDERLYFIIQFSGAVKSWKSIQSALKSMGGQVTRVLNESTLKLAIFPDNYENFVSVLEKERSLIVTIRESNSSDKFDEKFLSLLEKQTKPQKVTIEVSDLSGLSYSKQLTLSLEEFVNKNNETIELGYSTDNFAVYSGNLSANTIIEIAEQIETVESVEPFPKIALISYNDPIDENVELASVVSLSK